MNEKRLLIIAMILLFVAVVLVGYLIYSHEALGAKQKATDEKVNQAVTTLETIAPKIDAVLTKQDVQDATLERGLDAVAAGKWKIVEHRTEVRNASDRVDAIPDADLAERYRAVYPEFRRWYAEHYGPAADPRRDAPHPPDVGGPEKPADIDREPGAHP